MDEKGSEGISGQIRKLRSNASVVLATAPLAVAIGIFGVIYGAVARPLAEPLVVLAASAIIFSGAVQFTVVGLLLADASLTAVLAAAATINLRNLLLGAVLRPRLGAGPLRRAGLAWFLLDESFGLALTSERVERTLVLSGSVFYVAWLAGTAIGLVGGSVTALQDTAGAVFPVLFIGLSSISARSRGTALRALLGGGVTLAGAIVWPEARGLIAIVASLAVALPGRR
jgi:predicted branched-subunit amino acid permease